MDAAIMKEAGMSFQDVASLTWYWKRLLLGYKEPRQAQQSIDAVRDFIRKTTRTGAGGWKVAK